MAAKCPHNGKCGPCFLCGKNSVRYIHIEKMDKAVLALIHAFEDSITDQCVCHACYKHAARNIGNENYKPRWITNASIIKECHCDVVSCEQPVYRRTTIASAREIELIVGDKVVPTQDASVSTLLCKDHYTAAYTALHAPQPCKSCNAKPKWGEQHQRHCPDPAVINAYLATVSGEKSTLDVNSKICFVCYKLFKSIIAQFKQSKLILDQNSVIEIRLQLHSKSLPSERVGRIILKAFSAIRH